MKISSLIPLLIALLIPLGAGAQYIDVSNTLVIYFDEAFTVRETTGTGTIHAYVVAHDLRIDGSPVSALESWMFTMSYGLGASDPTPPAELVTAMITPRSSLSGPIDLLTWWFWDFEITHDTPIGLGYDTIVADLEFTLTAAVTVDLFFCPYGYVADGLDGQFSPLYAGAGGQMSQTCHVASINGQVPLAGDESSWSDLKTLFR